MASSAQATFNTDVKTRSAESHCVRCHSTFTRNNLKACVVPHVFDGDNIQIWQNYGPGYDKDYYYESKCCGSKKKVIEIGCGNDEFRMSRIGVHFRGRHATLEEDVQYNGINILRCKHDEKGECTRDVLEQDERPVFMDSYDRR
ncbi:hypothetical protein BJ138DRAFT_1103130 [Hygrophoropsis aurantiaca]|uniref:Uncharacterized protein n=1 Tax=Hygrophoropsis aurantiaca TaxID=72124 RepID=A0ACB8A6P1_9AGAM|nr:hypothetical protein BJ138DRAFT_1103130 [Hygrophoropsis aurantiaca]